MTSALDVDWWLASGPDCLPPVKEPLERSELDLNILEPKDLSLLRIERRSVDRQACSLVIILASELNQCLRLAGSVRHRPTVSLDVFAGNSFWEAYDVRQVQSPDPSNHTVNYFSVKKTHIIFTS